MWLSRMHMSNTRLSHRTTNHTRALFNHKSQSSLVVGFWFPSVEFSLLQSFITKKEHIDENARLDFLDPAVPAMPMPASAGVAGEDLSALHLDSSSS
jgi:hypothetical protein